MSEDKTKQSKEGALKGGVRNVMFLGRESVKLRVSRNEFDELRHSRQIARYDAEQLVSTLDIETFRKGKPASKICKQFCTNWTRGVLPWLCMPFIFLIAYYLVNYFLIQNLCTGCSYDICHNYTHRIEEIAQSERHFTKVLTFLLGFYVSFIFSRWWSQVSNVPTIDGVCLSLEGLLWCDRTKNEAKIKYIS